MKNPLYAAMLLSAIPSMFLSGLALAQKQDNEALAATIRNCDSCHAADSTIQSGAPVLNGLPRSYLTEQLQNFRADLRGAAAVDQYSRQMVSEAKALPEEQLSLIARHYARQKKQVATATVAGDVKAGEPLFEEHCAGCHTSTAGRMFTKSPPITHLEGPYILAQLKAFAASQRHFAEENENKLKMIEVASRFNAQQLADITAYIKTRDR
ncbi:MAG: c-type cytochrome [Pseudomonadales bacterium]|nr:c-type cytochrome [Pseudomonadales bacterium]